MPSGLIRGFEANRDRSGQLSVAIVDAHRMPVGWVVTIEMRYASITDECDEMSVYSGYVYPISATGRIVPNEAWIDELEDPDDHEALDTVLLPVELAGQLGLTRPQTNAAALRVAAHRLAAPGVSPSDLAAGLHRARLRTRRYCAARWRLYLRASTAIEAEAIANVVASTVVDQTGHPRGVVTEVERDHYGETPDSDPPSEFDPDELIAEIADHAANVAALRSPMLLAGAMLLRAWQIEAEEYENLSNRRLLDELGNADGKLLSAEELHDAELQARLMARGRSPAEMLRLSKQLMHERFLYSTNMFTIDPEVRQRRERLDRQSEVLRELAREMNGGTLPKDIGAGRTDPGDPDRHATADGLQRS